MISLVVSGVGAVVAAVGSGVLLARCFREPRGDIIAWSIALLGLLVSLGSQALGHLSGFDSAMFRGMEIGGQVIAPLALILGMSEVAAKRTAVRFCARLYIPALAIVAMVILGTRPAGPGNLLQGLAGSVGVLPATARLRADVCDRADHGAGRDHRRLDGDRPLERAGLGCGADSAADGRSARRWRWLIRAWHSSLPT